MNATILREDADEILAEDLPWQKFSKTTVLVTGAAGLLPAYFVDVLLRLNERQPGFDCRVVALVRDRTRAAQRLGHLKSPLLELVEQDVCAPLDYPGPIDFIVHGASLASPKHYGVDPIGTLSPNVFGTRALLELARARKTENFLFISSGEVYGIVPPEKTPTRETDYGLVDPLQVRSCYAESKRMGEQLCVAWDHQHGVPTVIVRPFHTYGPGLKLDDGRAFADFIADVVAGRDIVMKSDGSAVRPYCYVTDALKGCFTILLKGARREAYNLANDRAEASVLRLAETLVGLFPKKGLKVVRAVQDRGNSYLQSPIALNRPDVGKLRALGWSPRVTIEDGFRRAVLSHL